MWRKTQWHPENLNSRPLSSVPMLVQNLGSSLGEAWNQVPYIEVKERRTKVVDHCRLVGGSFDKQGNLQGLCWAATVPDRSLHLPTGTLKVFVAALTGSVMYAVQMVWTEPISRLCPWDSFWRGKASRMHIPRLREGVRTSDCPRVTFTFYVPTWKRWMVRNSYSLHPQQLLLLSLLFIFLTPLGVQWNTIVVLRCIFFTRLNIFSCAYLSSVNLLEGSFSLPMFLVKLLGVFL